MKRICAVIFCVFLLFSSAGTASAYNGNTTVYITRTGECYHRGNCGYLKSKISISLEDAVDRGYRACSKCNPPKLDRGDTGTRVIITTASERETKSEKTGLTAGIVGLGVGAGAVALFNKKKRGD